MIKFQVQNRLYPWIEKYLGEEKKIVIQLSAIAKTDKRITRCR